MWIAGICGAQLQVSHHSRLLVRGAFPDGIYRLCSDEDCQYPTCNDAVCEPWDVRFQWQGYCRASGLKWEIIDCTDRMSSDTTTPGTLLEALTRQTSFTQQEWDAFCLWDRDWPADGYVKTGEKCFRPECPFVWQSSCRGNGRGMKECQNWPVWSGSRNVGMMRKPMYGLQAVDNPISMKVLRRGDAASTWACRMRPSRPYATVELTMSAKFWHRRTMQIAGLGLTSQCMSGIAAFYHLTARFVRCLAQLNDP